MAKDRWRCPSSRPRLLAGTRLRCALTVGHAGPHTNITREHTWADPDPDPDQEDTDA